VLAAAGLTPILRRLLFGVGPLDPFTYLGVPALLILAASLACWWPARAASQVPAVEALRDAR
jgi:hypothetical protein